MTRTDAFISNRISVVRLLRSSSRYIYIYKKIIPTLSTDNYSTTEFKPFFFEKRKTS